MVVAAASRGRVRMHVVGSSMRKLAHRDESICALPAPCHASRGWEDGV